MAKKTRLDRKTKSIISSYISLLREEGIPVVKTIIFGSTVRGNKHKDSDIDVCVVSPKFGKDPLTEAMRLAKLARRVNLLIEPHPYSPKDLSEELDPLASEIRKFGLEVKLKP